MATRNVTARVALDGEKEYKQALQELNAGNKTLSSEMKKLQAEYKGNTESTEYLTKAGELLERQLLSQQEKVQKLREAVAYAEKEYGEASTTTQKYIQQLNYAEAAEFDLQHAIEENNAALQGENETMIGLGDTVDQLAGKLGFNLPDGARNALNGMQGLSAGTVAAMTAAAAAVAALAKVVSELTQLTLDVAAQVDEYLTESQITGVPEAMLQAWDYAAPLIDVDAETIKGAMTKLTAAMGDAQNGSESAQAQFEALSVSFQNEADGSLRSAEDVFYDVIDALGSMEAGAGRDAAAMELMGKSAQELNPLINAGSSALQEYGKEAQAAGYILDKEQIKKLAAVDDAYQKLQLTIEANRKQLAADFAPAAEKAMTVFSEAVQKAGDFLRESEIVENLGAAVTGVLGLVEAGMDLVESLPGWMNPIEQLSNAFKGLAIVVATVADAINVLEGIKPWNWGSGKLTTALGWNPDEMSNLQKVIRSGPEYVSYNATGNDNWRGGLTWVGENGPELVGLPGGSRIYSAQDSRALGGDTFYITIDAASVREFNDIVEMAQAARVQQRMR